jgi:hypothetical protein
VLLPAFVYIRQESLASFWRENANRDTSRPIRRWLAGSLLHPAPRRALKDTRKRQGPFSGASHPRRVEQRSLSFLAIQGAPVGRHLRAV